MGRGGWLSCAVVDGEVPENWSRVGWWVSVGRGRCTDFRLMQGNRGDGAWHESTWGVIGMKVGEWRC